MVEMQELNLAKADFQMSFKMKIEMFSEKTKSPLYFLAQNLVPFLQGNNGHLKLNLNVFHTYGKLQEQQQKQLIN